MAKTLPKLPFSANKYKIETVSMRGINFSDAIQDGDLAESKNLSARRYPYISTRRARAKQSDYSDVTALTAWGKLVAVSGTDLLYNGTTVGQVTEGAKQFAVVNTKLVIWPDKVYLDLPTQTVKPLGVSVSETGAEISTDTITVEEPHIDAVFPKVGVFDLGNAYQLNIDGDDTFYEGNILIDKINTNEFGITVNGSMLDLSALYADRIGQIFKVYSERTPEGVNYTWGIISGFNGKRIKLSEGILPETGAYDWFRLYSYPNIGRIKQGDKIKLSGFTAPENNTTVTARFDCNAGDSSFHVTYDEALTAGQFYGEIGMYQSNWPDLTELFSKGDGIEISGTEHNDGSHVIKEVKKRQLIFQENELTEESVTGELTVSRNIPDMDFICESENRLWGCSNDAQTIYASALGDPTNFNVSQGLSTDSYAVPVGSEGNFTGCCKLSSSVLFWKQNKLHKMLGTYPAEYSLYSYDIEGLQAGCNKSLQVINEVLFYMGLHGVYAYSGGTPSLISANFGEKVFTDAVSGNDGDSYYLSVQDGDRYRLMVYETRSGIWVHEDNIRCVDFARIDKDLYFADSSGDVYIADAGTDDASIEWYAQYTPFYETVQGRKVYSKMLLRLELPEHSYVIVETRQDGGVWREAGRVVGRKCDAVPIRIPLTRCDKFEIRLSGKGPCAILSMLREFNVVSEV